MNERLQFDDAEVDRLRREMAPALHAGMTRAQFVQMLHERHRVEPIRVWLPPCPDTGG